MGPFHAQDLQVLELSGLFLREIKKEELCEERKSVPISHHKTI